MSRRYQAAILTASYNGLQVPNAPTIGTATAGAGSASVTFTAPANVGGGAITSYTVISSPGSIIGTGASSPITVSGLTNGTAYTFTVVATNAYGSGPASAASNSVTPAVNYIENVFSTYLYTGTTSAQTITNNINISGNGGAVWIKCRNTAGEPHVLVDTARGAPNALRPNGADASVNDANRVSAFTTSGFALGTDGETNGGTSKTYTSWTFRKQEKFFDVVTWTGNGANRTIAHNLGSVPGCIIVKRTNTTSNWAVYHRSLTNVQYLDLNNNNDVSNSTFFWNSTTPTSTVFSLGNDEVVNASGSTYVAYVFAHNAGGFGLTGTDNVISCGSVVNTGNPQVTLGYEPQWVLFKTSDSFSSWYIVDNMRGLPVGGDQAVLLSNSTAAEVTNSNYININATGFTTNSSLLAGTNIVYIAIRRGPMAVPTVGTSVFAPSTAIEPQSSPLFTAGFSDMTLHKPRLSNTDPNFLTDRLRGNGQALQTNVNSASTFYSTYFKYDSNAGAYIPAEGYYNNSGGGTDPYALYAFRRAPQFFDEVILNSSTTTYTHNLTVSPELIFVKCTDVGGANWVVYNKSLSTPTEQYLRLNTTDGVATNGPGTWSVSSTQFSVDPGLWANGAAGVSYLFATCAGVSKVGSYTGTGALLTVDCSFTTGARFVFIKRTDSTGDWYVWDSARGITSGNDPYWLLNNAAVQVTGTNYVDTTGVGFQVTAAAPAGLNAVGGTYIFLAIA
jgi:hypothetical protein